MRKLRFGRAAALFTAVAFISCSASAGLIRAQTVNCGAVFSACDDSAFVAAAAGITLTFNDFSVDRFGGALPPAGAVNGNIYSADFTLSSATSGTFGGANSAQVYHANGSGPNSEVGPLGTGGNEFDGRLVIDFLSPIAALGFGTVCLGDNCQGVVDPRETITLFGLGGVLLGTFTAGAGVFDYEGFVATGGDRITRAVLEGDFFAIQNMKYGYPVAVAEPSSLVLFGAALAMLGLAAARRRTT